MKIMDLMTPEVEACRPATDLAAVSMIMWRRDCGIVPVTDEDARVVGVVTDRDICMALATRHLRAEELTAEQAMTDRVFSVRPEDDVRVALEVMRTRRVRRLPVLDADGRLRGLVSINDILMRAQPAGGRGAPALSANEVLSALQGICRHPLPATRAQEKDELMTVNT